MAIRLLPDGLARLIRAGEVVERPAAAVKELVENALDGGAANVEVCIARGGTQTLSVEDDGCGIPEADLPLLGLRHATSKLDGGDLSSVSTLGFRGEALSSMAAAGNLSVRTRARGSQHAWELHLAPGSRGEPVPCALASGTVATLDGLFSEFPARAAFLKAPKAEAAAVRAVVEAAALSRPDVGFRLVSDGRAVLSLRPSGWDVRARAVAGEAFAANSLPFFGKAPGLEARGIVAMPGWKAGKANVQRILVNGRPVTDRVVSSAVKAAYARFGGAEAPAAIVDIRLPNQDVDTNVSPAKSQVRFRNPEAVARLVGDAVAAALAGGSAGAVQALSAAASRLARPLPPDAAQDTSRMPLGRVLGVVWGGYAVSATEDGLVLTDLHAAAERATFERLRSEARSQGVRTRTLAAPQVIDVGAAGCAALEAAADVLAGLGLVVGVLDGTGAYVSGVPDTVPDHCAPGLVAEVAAALASDPGADPLGTVLDRICASAACHASFRVGDSLGDAEADMRLREIERTPNGMACMHGRPVSVILPRAGTLRLMGRD